MEPTKKALQSQEALLVEIVAAEGKMVFRVSGAVARKMSVWERALDEKIYTAQVETGAYGRLTVPQHRIASMKKMAKNCGRKRPYYGAIGGACSYEFRVTASGAAVKIVNDATRDFLEIEGESSAIHCDEQSALQKIRELTSEEVLKVTAWKNTEEARGSDTDYIYRFGLTSLGLTSKVLNGKTKASIDLTDYESW